MSIRATTALLLLAIAPLAAASKSNIAVKETFNIDSVHSTAIFRVQHLGAGNFYGRFNELEGTIDWEDAEHDGFEEVRPITDQGDAFEPPFELDTNEPAQWVRNAIAEFE